MSLANENDLIIPGTVGTISAAVKEANRHLDRYREHIVQDENKNKNIVLVCHSGIIKCLICYIKQSVYNIAQRFLHLLLWKYQYIYHDFHNPLHI